MATLVCFHAHPDDECITTGGTIARASAEGHRVVLVVATRGEHGDAPADLELEGETLAEHRVKEVTRSAEVLGVHRLEFLDYLDSGMVDTAENHHPQAFWQADVDVAAERLAAILRDEAADVLTIYDDHGNYGHPDHIQVHRVGLRAAEMAATARVFQATMNRDFIFEGLQTMRDAAVAGGMAPEDLPDLPTEVPEDFGSAEGEITAAVDVTGYLAKKREALRCHRSQVHDTDFFLAMPDDVFALAFGQEWFIRTGQGPGITETDLLAGL